MKRPLSSLLLLCAGLSTALLSASSWAVGTRYFHLQTASDLEGGELEGASVTGSGSVRAGLDLGATELDAATGVWDLLARPDGSLLVATGNEGKLLSVRGPKVEVLAETKALVMTSLAEAWKGQVVMGSLPEGKVLRLVQQGGKAKVETLVALPGAEHVWDLAYDAKTRSLFAVTGPEGKLFRITADGQPQVYFDAEEEHLISVAVAPDGSVLAGASEPAKLYRLSGPGRATVLRDFETTEVREIVATDKGEVFAIANEIKQGKVATRSKRDSDAKPARRSAKTKGKGQLWHFASDGRPEQLLTNDEEHFVSLAVGEDGRPYVGTGVEGRVYTVDETRQQVLVADTAERQIGALLMRGKQRYVASSDPAVLHPVRGAGGPKALWTSKVLDAGLRARFGRMTWEADGKVELSTRSGNTKSPDDTWSAWSPGLTAPGAVASPAARYLQIRARFGGGQDAVLHELTVPFITDNLRAVVQEIEAKPGLDSFVGGKVEESGGPVTKSPSEEIELEWEVDNPDRDELRYRLQYRLIGTTAWYDILPPKEQLSKTSYDWDTADLPEGRYRVRVTASDAISNPPGLATAHSLDSGVVLVDNTPPSIDQLRVAGTRITAVASDGVGPIARMEVSVAGSDEWFPFHPKDGLFDEASEELDAEVSSFVPPGRVLLAVRVYDSARNFVVRNVTLR